MIIIYWILHLLFLLYVVNVIRTYQSWDACWDKKNVISESIYLVSFLTVFIISWFGVISKWELVLWIIVALISCDIIETFIFIIYGTNDVFLNKGNSLRERKLVILMNIFYIGKMVKGVRLGGLGDSWLASLDLSNNNAVSANNISGKTLSIFQAIQIFRGIKARIKLSRNRMG